MVYEIIGIGTILFNLVIFGIAYGDSFPKFINGLKDPEALKVFKSKSYGEFNTDEKTGLIHCFLILSFVICALIFYVVSLLTINWSGAIIILSFGFIDKLFFAKIRKRLNLGLIFSIKLGMLESMIFITWFVINHAHFQIDLFKVIFGR